MKPKEGQEATTTAAAPSLTPGALPAVTVPPSLKAGLSLPRVSIDVSSRGASSVSNGTGSPFFWGIGTGRISSLNNPPLLARIARWWLWYAYSSSASFVRAYLRASISAPLNWLNSTFG